MDGGPRLAPRPAQVLVGESARALSRADRWRLCSPFLRRHGGAAISYATLQAGMEYFLDDRGYLAFVTVRHAVLAPRGLRVVLGDPMCAASEVAGLVRSFLADHPYAVFTVVSEACAAVLRDLGFAANCIGYEPELAIQTYNTAGDWNGLDMVRRARNEARREGVTIAEEDISRVDRGELDAVSARWIVGKKISDREIWLFARRPVFEHEPDVRKFVARARDGRVAGFVFYDPMYSDGRVMGYSANTPRTNEQQFGRLTTAIHMTAMDAFRAEGAEVLNLCLAPFVKLELGRYNDDRMLRAFFELTARFGDDIYNFHGLSFHKSKYRGAEKPIYLASRAALAANDLFLAYYAAGISTGYWSTMGRLLRGIARAKLPWLWRRGGRSSR